MICSLWFSVKSSSLCTSFIYCLNVDENELIFNYINYYIFKLRFFFQEPFVNIPEDTIREALKIVLGMRSS